MEIKIAVKEFTRALQLLHGVVQKKHMMPILTNVLLETCDNGLCLRATDLEISIRIKLDCEIVNAGSVTVSAKSLLNVSRSLPGLHATISSQLDGKNLFIKSIKTEARLPTLPVGDFPKFPDITNIKFGSILNTVFVDIIQKIIYATSIDEDRYGLTGIHIDIDKKNANNDVVFVATDGHRLSKLQISFDKNIFTHSIVFPKKGLMELSKILESDLSSNEKLLELGFFNNQAVFKIGESILTMRLIDGKFPDYHKVIPKTTNKIVRAIKTDLMLSLKRVLVLANDKDRSVKLLIKKGELIVLCVSSDTGEIRDYVPIEYSGIDMEISFNINYLMEAINSLSDHNIIIRLTDSQSPAIVTGVQESYHLCVLMPVRV